MNRHIIRSDDGSQSLFSETFGETYHSTSGALQETVHIFIRNGLLRRISSLEPLDPSFPTTINILEYGFGTGLNILLTLKEMFRSQWSRCLSIRVCTLEKYPLAKEEYTALDYGTGLFFAEGKTSGGIWPGSESPDYRELYLRLHEAPWGATTRIAEGLEIRKILCDFHDFDPAANPFEPVLAYPLGWGSIKEQKPLPWIDLVFFDAFSPSSEPDVWTPEILGPMSDAMKKDGVFVTYSAKGTVKQALRDGGMDVHRIPGAGEKRHSLVAIKI